MKDLFYATITNNNSPLKNGSVQFRIPELMDGITDDSTLPWALPDNTAFGGSNEYGESKIPEVDSLVWIWFEDFLKKKAFYISGINLKNFGPHKLFEGNIKSNIAGFSSSYPDIKYTYYKNGLCIAASSNESTPEFAIYHPSGAYIFIDSKGIINIQGSTGILEPTLLGQTFITALTTFLTGLNPSTLTAQALTFLGLITTFLSQSIKNS